MPVTAKKKTSKKALNRPSASPPQGPWPGLIAAALGGGLLGLSAPGFNQWYLAWFGVVPLVLLIVGSRSIAQAFVRGLIFGLAYNLVYLNWYLGLHPLTWLGFNWWQSMLLAVTCWLIVSGHQALITGLFAAVCRWLPLIAGFLPRKAEKHWRLPALLLIPLLWVIIHNKLGNAHDALGVPWTMLEYSQYEQLPLIQVTSLIGGIGLGLIIVLVNVTLAQLIATISGRDEFKALSAPTLSTAWRQTLTVALLLAGCIIWGNSNSSQIRSPSVNLAVLQGNINIDMQKTEHRYTLNELYTSYERMAADCRNGICIWTESALPAYLRKESKVLTSLKSLAQRGRLDMVVGSLDLDQQRKAYNSAVGITSGGALATETYHKRYLVPFGEYMPFLVQYLPEFIQRLTNTPAGGGFAAGTAATVLTMPTGKIAPLICFETISPELVVESVRQGGQLLVNISDLAWFHDSMIGEQMIAFSVLRAAETQRYFVFAANSGPSAIIEPSGKISARCGGGKQVLSGKVEFCPDVTAFTQWFR